MKKSAGCPMLAIIILDKVCLQTKIKASEGKLESLNKDAETSPNEGCHWKLSYHSRL